MASSSKLKSEDISYLALEGGGGKGFAYLGALQLLEKNQDKHNVLSQLKGVAGTSAGAITALMISLGMTADEIRNKIRETNFDSFFDSPEPRLVPQASFTGKYDDTRTPSDVERAKLASNLDPSVFDSLAAYLQSASEELGPGHLPGWIVWAGIAPMLRGAAEQGRTGYSLLERALNGKYPQPVGKLAANWAKYLVYLDRDMGLFSGFTARSFFDDLIATRAAAVNGGDPKQYRNLPFRLHKDIFKRELLVCAANLSTGKTELMSARPEHTPNFPVADAVRISMSLPLIYKPYVLTEKKQGWPPCGTYVDGGLWNNIPLREIEPIPDAKPTPAYGGWQPPDDGGWHPPMLIPATRWPAKTLALRLSIDPPSRVLSAMDVMTQMLQQIVGTGESQALSELEYMCVTLDTSDLSLLQFQPDDAVRDRVTKRSRRAISKYFGWPIAISDNDDQDDQKAKSLQAKSVCDSGF